MDRRFPLSLEELDAAWLTRAFQDRDLLGADEAVARFEVAPIGAGFGQTGESARLLLRYKPEQVAAPASAFIKFATKDDARRQASQRLGLYRREVDFYNRLAPRANVRAPACYFADVTSAGDYATVMLEDFPDHRPGDDIAGLQPREAEMAIDLLTDLHGPYWGKAGSLDLAPLQMGTRERFVGAWQEMEERFGEYLPDQVRDVRERFLDAIQPLHEWLVREPATLGHGDLKLDNILFGAGADDPLVAVDWQAVRPQKGMRDFAYLVSHSMNVADRRAHERDFMLRYIDRLKAYGIVYPIEQAQDDYRKSMLFDFCTVLYVVGVNLNTNERAIRRKKALMERSVTALLDWDSFALLDQFT